MRVLALLCPLAFAILATAYPQSSDSVLKVDYHAYNAGDADCNLHPGIQSGTLQGVDNCVVLPPGYSGGPFAWKTTQAKLQVGLFLSDDCHGDYKPFMASYISQGYNCEMTSELKGNPAIGTYRSMKILADCSSQAGCVYGE